MYRSFPGLKMASDPWIVQPHEHVKFAEHFRSLGPVNGMVGGEQAKRFMLQVCVNTVSCHRNCLILIAHNVHVYFI